MAHSIPTGFQISGVHCGIKQDQTREDLSLFLAQAPCVAVGVYTQNRVLAASVLLNKSRTPSDRIRAVIVNSGNANACTGQRGMDDAREMSRLVAKACGLDELDVLVMSTGIIGEHLPMEKVQRGIEIAGANLDDTPEALRQAASGMLTTDTREKVVSRVINLNGKSITILGLAKGAAMIGPNMATMLGLIMTDARVNAPDAQNMLQTAVDASFNCITVEGHTSTSDTVLLLASGTANQVALTGDDLAPFQAELADVCVELARMIPADGEGATHLIEVNVNGCATRDDARKIAKAVADGPLVKTAIAGADPNWGRIVSAAGYAGVDFDPNTLELALNGTTIYSNGVPHAFDAAALSQSIRDNRDTHIELNFQNGDASIRFWTCDLTTEYVRLNADYHT